MKSTRTEKLNSEFRKIIYEVVKNELNIPTVTEMFSITEVDVAPDLKSAKVYVSVYSTDLNKKQATFLGIKDSASKIRKALSSKLRIKYVPELRFYEDGALEYGNKIDKILSTITYGDTNDDN
ncbi:MAG: 30S ribosome-binding factor RbfA [Clostridia bacterium]|nr:30S ribosome-binding factor RbfA [Clostridia bacterium]